RAGRAVVGVRWRRSTGRRSQGTGASSGSAGRTARRSGSHRGRGWHTNPRTYRARLVRLQVAELGAGDRMLRHRTRVRPVGTLRLGREKSAQTLRSLVSLPQGGAAVRIAVAGAGLAGLAAAAGFTRRGHDVIVYEQAESLRASGLAFNLAPNATSLLSGLGV